MANVDKVYGFRLERSEGKCIVANKYVKQAGAAFYPGDTVKLEATGDVSKYAAGEGKILGVVAEYEDAASTECFVYDDPSAVYRVQATTATAADVGANADISATDTPDTNLRQSGNEIDGGTFAATATLPWKVEGIAAGQEDGADADVLVKMNNCVKGSGDGSTGI